MTSTFGFFLRNATRQLQGAGIVTAALDAGVLLGHVLGISRESVLMSQEKTLDKAAISAFKELVARRAQHEPIAYILGEKEFWSLDFYVTRDTLIPRPDSETLVEAALKRVKGNDTQGQANPITVLDIGTGSGCLLIALLSEIPAARGTGVDNSERALQVARKNAKRHGVDNRASFLQSHWCDAINGTFDLIISNPPYIAEGALSTLMPDVAHYEPHGALFAGSDGLDGYRALAPRAARKLSQGGHVLLEVAEGQAEDVARLLAAEGLLAEAPIKDMAGIARCVAAVKPSQ